ncbi:MAG TPA: 3-oxoacyl-[acyl-carrier-protein] synthase III C-terminal domain-containing protein [Polyangiaceae bacterium]
MKSVGIKALAVDFPKGIRTSRFWHNHHPEILEAVAAKKQRRIWAGPDRGPADPFEAEMAKYLSDPFRGTVERRVLTPGEGALSLETSAAKKALAAAAMAPSDVDLLIVASFLPDHIGAQDSSYLARELELRGMAFNLESACSGAMVGLNTASALIAAGQYDNALVVTSCTYSRDTDTRDTISWTVGDGAGAFVLGEVEPGYGRLGGHSLHTGRTCGALWYENYTREDGALGFRLQSSPYAASVIRDCSKDFLIRCCHGALEDARVRLEDIDAFVFNTPLAWYAKYCANTLGVDSARVIDTYPRFANMGPALLPVNLYHAARELPIEKDDLVLMYSIGSVSSAGAMVVRWGDVALGEEPSPPELLAD